MNARIFVKKRLVKMKNYDSNLQKVKRSERSSDFKPEFISFPFSLSHIYSIIKLAELHIFKYSDHKKSNHFEIS